MTYKAVVARITTRPIPGCDNIVMGNVLGHNVIVGKDTPDGSLIVYFDLDGQLSEEFCEKNDLYPRKDENGERVPESGYFEKNRKVKHKKFKGVISEGFVCGLDKFEYTGTPFMDFLVEGFEFDTLNGHKICNRYETPATIRQRQQQGLPKQGNIMFKKHIETSQLRTSIQTVPEGAHIIITSKLHETCVPSNTPIRMADGSKKNINRIQEGELVQGLSETGEVVTSKVKNVWSHGKVGSWIKITGKPKGLGNGNSTYTLVCTHDHLVLLKDKGYTESKDIKVGDQVLLYKKSTSMTDIQHQILIGKMIGDGHLNIQDQMAKVEFGHKVAHEGYVDWLLQGLGELANPTTLWQTVTKVEEIVAVDYKTKWDIETETGNFFANDILVHNSHRLGKVMVERPIKRNWWQRLFAKWIGEPDTEWDWEVVHGTRNVELGPTSKDYGPFSTGSDGFYGSNGFRYRSTRGIEPAKGEVIYGEIVGWSDLEGKSPIQSQATEQFKEKSLTAKFGPRCNYLYGCQPGEAAFYIYRITQVNEDGYVVELAWHDVVRRCKELGLVHVPVLDQFIFNSSLTHEDISKHVNVMVNGVSGKDFLSDPLDENTIREGVVLRIESEYGTVFMKEKSVPFKVLEGIMKEDDTVVDIEEAS